VIVCGDLTHALPGCVGVNDQELYEAQVKDYKELMSKVDENIPLVCLCGNHDIGNTPTAESIKSYSDRFGDDYFSFWVNGVKCLVLNASLYSDPEGAPILQKNQEEWLQQQLNKAKEENPTHILVFQHQPWFLNKPDEEDQYFNINKERRLKALSQLKAASVTAVFAGHYHRNCVGFDDQLEMITTSAVGRPLGDDPSGFRVVNVYKERISHKYYGLEELPEKVTL